MKAIFLGVFLLLNCKLYAQVFLGDLNFEKIPYKKVRNYIHEQIENHILTINDLFPTVESNIVPADYSSQEKRYVINEDINKVWKSYIQTSPADSWDGKRVSFGLLCSKRSEKIVYRGGECSKIDTGQVVYLNLRLLRGVYNLALAFEFINVDVENRVVEFSYIQGNTSEGKQCLHFIEKPNGKTEIIHTSYFKSDSKLRDKLLYPFFHKRATNEFHRNMRRIIRKDQA
jgi:hypothetical protein